MTMAQKKTVEA